MAQNYTVFPMTFPATFGNGLPTSTNKDVIEMVKEVLQGAEAFGFWSLSEPDFYRQNEVSQRDKQNNESPSLYVWSPIDADLAQFSGDTDSQTDIRTVEISIWTLDNSNTHTYHEDCIDLLQEYADDNYTNIEFHHIRTNASSDMRAEHIARQTDHYIMNVQAEVHDLRNK
jgi:hypothetical protein